MWFDNFGDQQQQATYSTPSRPRIKAHEQYRSAPSCLHSLLDASHKKYTNCSRAFIMFFFVLLFIFSWAELIMFSAYSRRPEIPRTIQHMSPDLLHTQQLLCNGCSCCCFMTIARATANQIPTVPKVSRCIPRYPTDFMRHPTDWLRYPTVSRCAFHGVPSTCGISRTARTRTRIYFYSSPLLFRLLS